jgi:signal transduction histidine kinase
MRLSLRLRLPLTFLLLISITSIGAALSVVPALKDHFLMERQIALLTQGSVIANAVRDELVGDGQGVPYLTRTFAQRLNSRVLVLNPQGVVLVDAFGELEGTSLRQEEILASLQGQTISFEQRSPAGEPALYVLVPISRVERLDDGQRDIIGVVFISNSLAEIYDTLDSLRRRLLIGALTTGLLAAAAGLYVSLNITSPLSQLTEGVKKIAGGSLGSQVSVKGDRETYELARAFNQMSSRMAAVEEARRRFISDASHEMRTPLAAMKALIEPIVVDPQVEVDTVREFLSDVDKEVDRLARLVEDLLQLVQLDSKPDLNLEEMDLSDLINRVCVSIRPLADSRGVAIKGDLQPVVLAIDESKLYRAILNLLDNAVKFARSSVSITLSLAPRQVSIHIADDGPGIPEESLGRLFERFYRVDKARVRSTGGGGLGLPIAAEIVELHGGSISVDSTLGEGAVFRVDLPLT